jgi:hypothetical protein
MGGQIRRPRGGFDGQSLHGGRSATRQMNIGGPGGVHVVAEQAFQPCAAVGDGIRGGERTGILADQVVHPVAAMFELGEQVVIV